MKPQAPHKESSLAWFKLAELINRGEKEKVLTLYRLLSHSFEDKAYALQVEGDILLAFDDKGAVTKYQQAAFLYKKEQKTVAAVGIYEHLFTVEPANLEYLTMLLELYIHLDWSEKWKDRFGVLLSLYHKQLITAPVMEKTVISIAKVIKGMKPEGHREVTLSLLADILRPHFDEGKIRELF